MRPNSTSARCAVCCAVALSLWLPSSSKAVGTTKVIAANATDIPFGLSISRDNYLAVPNHLNGQYGLFTYSNSGGIVNPGLPSGLRAFTASISPWGLAVLTDHSGFIPNDIYAAPRGQQLQLLQSGQGYSDFDGTVDLNDQGVITFRGRLTNNHGEDLIWRSIPSSPPSAQQLPLSGREEYFTSNLDSSGRIYTLAGEESSTPFTFSVMSYDDTNGWVNRTAGFSGVEAPTLGNVVAVNPSGLFTFPGSYDNNTKHGIYLATPGGIKFLFDRTSVNGPLNPIDANVSISDRGDVLAIIGQSSNVPLDKRTLFYTYDGRFIDLNSILPPGKDTSSLKNATLSYDGHLLVETRDLLSGKWEYYSYDGTTTSLLLDLTNRALNPRLGNDGQIYFYQQISGGYSLLQTVPEPASMLILAAGLLALSSRRRVRR